MSTVAKRSTKYDHVQPKVESGMTVDVARYMKNGGPQLKPRRGELFKRWAPEAAAESVLQKYPAERLEDGGYAHPLDEYRGGISEGVINRTDFLIVDCRTLEDFETCHIKGALFYPKTRVHHATTPFLPEMYAFRNKENKVILLYDLEEETVCELANLFYQKSIDNVGILAGGLSEFVRDYISCVEGEYPYSIEIVPRDERLRRRADEITVARSEARSTISKSKPKSLSNSLKKPQEQANHFRF